MPKMQDSVLFPTMSHVLFLLYNPDVPDSNSNKSHLMQHYKESIVYVHYKIYNYLIMQQKQSLVYVKVI